MGQGGHIKEKSDTGSSDASTAPPPRFSRVPQLYLAIIRGNKTDKLPNAAGRLIRPEIVISTLGDYRH